MSEVFDIAVIGAGAAGLSAAYVAAQAGCSVVVVDSNQRPGGQYHRRAAGESIYRSPMCSNPKVWDAIDIRTATTAYAAAKSNEGFTIHLRGPDLDRGDVPNIAVVRARIIIVATGAHDRHLPVPGWDLPGVMAGGGAQALIKGSGVVPGARTVVAGTGPFLLAVAQTIINAGGEVVAVVEAHRPTSLLSPALATAAPSKVGELGRYLATLARHRVPYLFGHRVRAVHGTSQVKSVTVSKIDDQWRAIPGTDKQLMADTLAIGYGFTAQVDLLVQLACRMTASTDGGLAAIVDEHQHTSVPGVFAAGETTGVGGVDLAEVEGLLAGAGAARHLGKQPELAQEKKLIRKRHQLRLFAEKLGTIFSLREGWKQDLRDDTVVCRCEEITAGSIRVAIHELGATDPRSVKLLTRAGMGWCQGRICGLAVDGMCPTPPNTAAKIAAAARPLAVPVSLGALDQAQGDST